MNDLTATLEMSELVSAGDLRMPALTVLAHPDPTRISGWTALPQRVELSRSNPTFENTLGPGRESLGDPFISRQPVLLTELDDGGWCIDATQTRTTVEIDGRALSAPHTISAEALDAGVVIDLGARVTLLLHSIELPRPGQHERLGLIGHSSAIEEVRRAIDQVAPLDVPVLIRGESGVGKELVARAIHRASRRAEAPYEAVNMAAVPPHLAAAELFGAEKGAFTGADASRPGHFARTDRGTLFLDEVGDTPGEVQPQLLRALETHDIHPVGATKSKTVDVRVISATDARLEEAVRKQAFREALLHRLAGFQIHVPPLRARREDIGVLLLSFVRAELETLGRRALVDVPDPKRPWLAPAVVARLARYAWPGNVRQLKNVARQLVIRGVDRPQLSLGPELEALLPPPAESASAPVSGEHPAPPISGEPPAPSRPGARAEYADPSDIPPERLLEVLRAHAFRVAPAAKALGISRTSMYTLMEASPHVRKAADLGPEEITDALAATAKLADAAARLEVSAHALKLRMTALGLDRPR